MNEGVFSFLKGDRPTNSLPLFLIATNLDTTVETFNLDFISSKYSFGYFILNRSGSQKKETDDNDIKKMLKKMIKQRAESIEVYKKNNRDDLLQIEKQEQEILSSYLPKQMSEEETKKICSEVISSTKASSIKDMGKVMGELKKKYSDTLDFSLAGKVLKELLNK